MKNYWGLEVYLHEFLSSVLHESECSHSGRFAAGERDPVTHWIGGWLGLRAVYKLDGMEMK